MNFVADLPVRVDAWLDDESRSFGNVVFVLTEFQLVDQETALENERGDNNHEEYKARQHRSVRHRLMRGLEKRNEQPREEPAAAPARVLAGPTRPRPMKAPAARRSPDRRRRPR